jgi:hypothetical protein
VPHIYDRFACPDQAPLSRPNEGLMSFPSIPTLWPFSLGLCWLRVVGGNHLQQPQPLALTRIRPSNIFETTAEPPACNSTSACQTTSNATNTALSVITRQDALDLFKAFCPSFEPGLSNVSCGNGGVEIQALPLCNVTHVLTRNQPLPKESRRWIIYFYNASRNGLTYSARVKCRRTKSM